MPPPPGKTSPHPERLELLTNETTVLPVLTNRRPAYLQHVHIDVVVQHPRMLKTLARCHPGVHNVWTGVSRLGLKINQPLIAIGNQELGHQILGLETDVGHLLRGQVVLTVQHPGHRAVSNEVREDMIRLDKIR